jgi:aldehyde:ferredoxin oxidoreductase
MSGGYTGKSLIINLKKKKIDIEKTNIEDAKNFIGAKGLGAKILYDRLPKKTDPLSPTNILMFTTGPLTGTLAQTSGRGTVVTKSPQTGLFLDSHFGGIFAAEMKKAGWDFIIFNEKATHPIYISIFNESVEFKDAKKLWTKECLDSHNWLQKNEGKVRTAVIGPAGENLVKFSSITIDGHRHAGRGGPGAVMGSKNLKAVIIKGNNKVTLEEPEKFKNKAIEVMNKIKNNDFIPLRHKFGTPYWVKPINDWGFLPTRNYQEGNFEDADAINAETMQEKIVVSSGACWNCIIACWNKTSIKNGKYKGLTMIGPEYETIALMGSNLGIKTIEEVAFLNNRCNEVGMDTISLGGVLGFAIEAYERGIISKEDLDGNEIGWSKTEQLAKLIDIIGYKKSTLGEILSEGVKIASQKLGKNSKDFAVHASRLEIPGYDPRGAFGMGLAYATSDRGGCHQRAWTVKQEIIDPDLERFSFDKKAKLVKDIQDERASFFSLVFCDFAPISEGDCVDLFNSATGFNHSIKSYLECGERIWNIIRLFNLREGLDPTDEKLPTRFFKDPFTKGPAKDKLLSKIAFEKSLLEYYKLRGWDEQGIPTNKKLEQLGLMKYLDELKDIRYSDKGD